MRIGFVHTVGFLVDRFRGLMAEQHPKADCFHILNEGLLQDLLRGQDVVRVYRRVTATSPARSVTSHPDGPLNITRASPAAIPSTS